MDEALKEARTALAQQIRARGKSAIFTDQDLLARINRAAVKSAQAAQRVQNEFEAGLQDRANRARVLGAPPPPDTLGGVYGTRPSLIWVDDIAEVEDDAKYAGKVKIVDPDKYAGKGSSGALPPPPKMNNAWFGEYSQAVLSPAPKPAVLPTVTEANIVEKVAATSDVYDEYEQFKVWLYRMIAEAQDDTSPAFVYSVAKIKFQPLRAAVAKVVKLGALNMLKDDTKKRLVEFQQWVDRVKPDEVTWQVTGKELLSNLARVIDPYAT